MKSGNQLFFLYLVILPFFGCGQSHNYWTRNFNETSSLLSGAVVGGGAGPSAIYYNPAIISDINKSNLSLNASLFSVKLISAKNAFGDELDLKFSKGIFEPRFISYMLKPINNDNWTFEVAFLNNENFQFSHSQAVDEYMDILKNTPGTERYFAFYQTSNTYRDDWVGIGASRRINQKWFVGASMFSTIRSFQYGRTINCEAYPVNNVSNDDFFSAEYQKVDLLNFNDYRLLWKAGVYFKGTRISFGATITTPSVGGIYADGKKVFKKTRQSNITSTETGEPIPDYVVVNFIEKDEMIVDSKSPLSVAAGLNYQFNKGKKVLFTTFEYFAKIEPFYLSKQKTMNGNESPTPDYYGLNDYMGFVSGARPVLNAAVGYRWRIHENILLMAGLRTDFNYRKNVDFSAYSEYLIPEGFDFNIYHFSGGVSWNILGQDVITGLQYSYGQNTNERQLVNFSDPVEYNSEEKAALQGSRQYNVNSRLNSISIYLGATFNFGKTKENE